MQYNDLFLIVKKEIYDYEKMYKALLNDYKNLEIRYKNLKVELKVIQIKQEKPKAKTQIDFVAKVKQTINDFYKIDIDVKIRKSEFILGRAIYSAILMGKSKMQQSQIAKTLNLDRTTIYNCMKNHEDWMLYDKNYKKDYEAILNIIENENTTNNN
jgi:hypothetical protein